MLAPLCRFPALRQDIRQFLSISVDNFIVGDKPPLSSEAAFAVTSCSNVAQIGGVELLQRDPRGLKLPAISFRPSRTHRQVILDVREDAAASIIYIFTL